MLKVEHKDLEDIAKFLDKISLLPANGKKAKELSKMIKDKYIEIKPDYEL